MKKLVVLLLVVTTFLFYELSYRFIVKNYGEVDTDSSPPVLYFSLTFLDPVVRKFYFIRSELVPIRATLDGGGISYLRGNFYIKRNNEWIDLSAAINHRNSKK